MPMKIKVNCTVFNTPIIIRFCRTIVTMLARLLPVYEYEYIFSVLKNQFKSSSFWLSYQQQSSSVRCARELLQPSEDSKCLSLQ